MFSPPNPLWFHGDHTERYLHLNVLSNIYNIDCTISDVNEASEAHEDSENETNCSEYRPRMKS